MHKSFKYVSCAQYKSSCKKITASLLRCFMHLKYSITIVSELLASCGDLLSAVHPFPLGETFAGVVHSQYCFLPNT